MDGERPLTSTVITIHIHTHVAHGIGIMLEFTAYDGSTELDEVLWGNSWKQCHLCAKN